MKNKLKTMYSPDKSLIGENPNYIAVVVGIFIFIQVLLLYLFVTPIASAFQIFPISFDDYFLLVSHVFKIVFILLLYYTLDSMFSGIKENSIDIDVTKIILYSYIFGIAGFSFALVISFGVPPNVISLFIVSFSIPLAEVLVTVIVINKHIVS